MFVTTPSIKSPPSPLHPSRLHTAHSQMDVIKFLAARPEALGPLADATLGQLGVLDSAREVVSVDPLTPTLAAFAMLASRQLAGAPVVADTGDLIANLSISDLR